MSPFTTAEAARAFTLAGNARVTLVSKKTGARYTYRVARPQNNGDARYPRDDVHFVSLLTGPDNDYAYTYIGLLKDNVLRMTAQSKMTVDSPPVAAFNWFARKVLTAKAVDIPEALEVWHEGRCGRCGRTLTVPSSIESGIGPECSRIMCEGV